MSAANEDKTLDETCHVGMLEVAIEGEGKMKINAIGEPLRLLASQVGCFLA